MIGVVAKISVHPGRGAAFESAFAKLRAAVKQHEPGTLVYELFKNRAGPDLYVAMEIYADQAALDAHQAAPHFAAAGAEMASLFAAPPDIEFFDGLGETNTAADAAIS